MFTRLKTHRRMAQGVGHHLLPAARIGEGMEMKKKKTLFHQDWSCSWTREWRMHGSPPGGEFLTENPSFEGNSRARRCTLQK